MSRKFYRTVVQVEILSETPYEGEGLDGIYHDITNGDCSGNVEDVVRNEEVDGKTMADLLKAQGSDPEFFQIDDNGDDLDDGDDLDE